jgi:hypothetical protein
LTRCETAVTVIVGRALSIMHLPRFNRTNKLTNRAKVGDLVDSGGGKVFAAPEGMKEAENIHTRGRTGQTASTTTIHASQ